MGLYHAGDVVGLPLTDTTAQLSSSERAEIAELSASVHEQSADETRSI